MSAVPTVAGGTLPERVLARGLVGSSRSERVSRGTLWDSEDSGFLVTLSDVCHSRPQPPAKRALGAARAPIDAQFNIEHGSKTSAQRAAHDRSRRARTAAPGVGADAVLAGFAPSRARGPSTRPRLTPDPPFSFTSPHARRLSSGMADPEADGQRRSRRDSRTQETI